MLAQLNDGINNIWWALTSITKLANSPNLFVDFYEINKKL
jgi:hypothetical protein